MKRIDFNNANTWKFIGLVLMMSSMIWFGYYFFQEAVTTLAENKGNKLPIYSVETDKKVVSISFDAAWGNEDTRDILNILDQYDVKATFFLVSRWIDQFPEDVKLIAEKGHDIGNHSTTHPHMTKLSSEQCQKQIMDAHQKVLDLTGYKMDLFRCPYGDYDGKVLDAVRDCGYYTIQWDVEGIDIKVKQLLLYNM